MWGGVMRMIDALKRLRAILRLYRIEKAIGYNPLPWVEHYIINNPPPGRHGEYTIACMRGNGKSNMVLVYEMVWSNIPIRIIRKAFNELKSSEVYGGN